MIYSKEQQKRVTAKIRDLSKVIADVTEEVCLDSFQNPFNDPNYPVLISQELLNIVIMELLNQYRIANRDYQKVANKKLKELAESDGKKNSVNVGG
jgi:hypothetical protein